VVDELNVANAHPLGAKPFTRADYRRKFQVLTESTLSGQESRRFLDTVQELPDLPAGELRRLNLAEPTGTLVQGKQGIF
jgi:2-methylcitrate dehydratase